MEVKRFSTIIDLNEIQDEAVAIIRMAIRPHVIYQRQTPDGKITGYRIATKCTAKEYMIFKNIVEKYYPGVCAFDPAIEK